MPRKKPSTVAKLNARIAELETILAGTRAQLIESEKISMAKVLNAAFETFNGKHKIPMPIKPRPIQKKVTRSRVVQIRGIVTPAIIENYQEYAHEGKITFWGSNSSKLTVREDEILLSEWTEAPKPAIKKVSPVAATATVDLLPPAPTEEDEFHPVENPRYKGSDYHDF